MKEQLEQVREWADGKLAAGEEPPWAWFQYMKLREVLDQILDGMDTTTQQMENSPQSEQTPGSGLRLVASNAPKDNAQSHRSSVPVRLPT